MNFSQHSTQFFGFANFSRKMQKITTPIWLFLFLLIGSPIYSQVNNLNNTESTHSTCGHSFLRNQAEEKNPALLGKREDWEKQLLKSIQKKEIQNLNKSANLPYVIPVVVHIVHNDGPENISDQQVFDGIDHINEALANEGFYDRGTGSDTGIRVCLATRDPNGAPTNGIIRVKSSATSVYDDVLLKSLSHWDATQYLNIYVNRVMCVPFLFCLAGYATFPTEHGTNLDGIVVTYQHFGQSKDSSSVSVHEIGHYLGLYHTFEGGCVNNNCQMDGDRICDTPPDATNGFESCIQPSNSCNTDANPNDPNNPLTFDMEDISSNYMDYSAYDCFSQFTDGQIARMQNVLETTRTSLLNTINCAPPCPFEISANFAISDSPATIGETIFFTDESVGGQYYDWRIDDIPFGGTEYIFTELGTYEISLDVTTDNPICRIKQRQMLEVVCNAQANFSADDLQVIIGGSLELENTSTGASSINWTVDGNVMSSNNEFVFTPTESGYAIICINAESSFCQTEYCETVFVRAANSGQEICDNEIDDDGDGLIDCFDPDCCGTSICEENYYEDCPNECAEDELSASDISIQLEWTTDPDLILNALGYEIIAGDVNGDGVPDVVIGQETLGKLALADGRDGSIIWEIPMWDIIVPTIADVDKDGTAEIFIGKVEIKRIEHDGTVTARTTAPGTETFSEKHIMDFNQDGNPELFDFPYLYDAQTLTLLSTVPFGAFQYPSSFGRGTGVAVDVMEASAVCPDCDGLEYVIGPYLFSVHPTTFNFTRIYGVEVDPPYAGVENLTSIADVDLDGDLDAVVTGRGAETRLFVWDLQTPTIISRLEEDVLDFNFGSFVRTAIADLDNDLIPEIIGMAGGRIIVFNNDLKSIDWAKPYGGLGITTASVFDVNGDGNPEIIYRGAGALQIINGLTGELSASIPCGGFYSDDMPAILDVDNDGEAEILCSCQNRVHVFGSAGEPWANTRQVWNQNINFNVHINDDLSVPKVQQKHHLVNNGALNSFLQQSVIPNKGPDCTEICGNGIDDDNDGLIDCDDEDCCENDFCDNQITPCTSCIFNRDLDLGEDISACENSSTTFNAGSGFETYLWPDMSTDSIYTAIGTGPIWVTTTDSCGTSYTDTIQINLDLSTVAALGTDQTICQGDSILLSSQNTFDSNKWYSANQIICENCPSFWAKPTENQIFIFEGQFNNGCSSSDTIQIFVDTPVSTFDTLYICEDESIEVFGNTISSNQTLSMPFSTDSACDSISTITVGIKENTFSNEVIRICEGTSIDFFGESISSDTILQRTIAATNACDSLEIVEVIILENRNTSQTISLCEGESLNLLGVDIIRDTTLFENLTANNGCDSTHQINIEFDDVISINSTLTFCEGESTFVNGIEIFQDTIISNFGTSAQGCDSTNTMEFIFYDNSTNNESYEACEGGVISIQGVDYSQDTLLLFSGQNVVGCDSTSSIQIQFFENKFTDQFINSCEGEIINIADLVIENDTIIEQILVAENGCDSTHLITILFDDIIEINSSLTFCEGESTFVNGIEIFQDTIISNIGISAQGCDSTNTVEVVFLNNSTNYESYESCEGSVISVQGMDFIQDTIIIFNGLNEVGCDSSSTIEIQFFENKFTDQFINSCEGESIDILGQAIENDTIIEQILIAENGCDSTHLITIIFDDVIRTNAQIDICEGTSTIINGVEISQDTVINISDISVQGCDSTHTVQVNLLNTSSNYELLQACEGGVITVEGLDISEDTVLIFNEINEVGCDSTSTIEVEFLENIFTDQFVEVCEGEEVIILGQPINTDTTIQENLVAENGCDSIHTFVVSILESYYNSESLSTCQGIPLIINGESISNDTIIYQNFIAQNGCDSTLETTVMIEDIFIQLDSVNLCAGEYVVFYGDTIQSAGFYENEVFPQSGNCDSLFQLFVEFAEAIDLIIETSSTCIGENGGALFILNELPNVMYSIDGNNFQSDTDFYNLSQGEYSLYAMDENNCISSVPFLIEITNLIEIYLADEIDIIDGEAIEMPIEISTAENLFSISWSPSDGLACDNCLSPTILSTNQSLYYYLELQDVFGCIFTDSIYVNFDDNINNVDPVDNKLDVFFPNVFSPNGDGINDIFKPYTDKNIETVSSLQVYDRFGKLLYERNNFTPNATIGWDGKFGDRIVNVGVYMYLCTLRTTDGQELFYMGDVTIMR